ncbi:unnamed protein product [Symbiodinium sp. CCMP2456]|nr:unnamed protein product [Symbiodinium sp. CCMP2456]
MRDVFNFAVVRAQSLLTDKQEKSEVFVPHVALEGDVGNHDVVGSEVVASRVLLGDCAWAFDVELRTKLFMAQCVESCKGAVPQNISSPGSPLNDVNVNHNGALKGGEDAKVTHQALTGYQQRQLDKNELEVAARIEKRNAVEGGQAGHSRQTQVFRTVQEEQTKEIYIAIRNPVVFFATFVQKIGESVAGQLELQYPTSSSSRRLWETDNIQDFVRRLAGDDYSAQLTKYVSYVPTSVQEAFLSCIGYKVFKYALKFSNYDYYQFVPAACVGVPLYFMKAMHIGNPAIVMPLGILLPLAIFWAIVLGAGYDVDADTSDFFFPKMSNEPFYLVWTDSIGQYSKINFTAWTATFTDLGIMILVVVLDCSLKISSTENKIPVKVDKNYEISLYGAVNAIVSVFASTVGSMGCIQLEVWVDPSRFTKSDFAKGVVVRLKPAEVALKRASPSLQNVIFQNACLVNESFANGRAVATLRSMKKLVACSLSWTVHKQCSWPSLSQKQYLSMVVARSRRPCEDTYTETTRTARMPCWHHYHGDTQKYCSCTSANHPTRLSPKPKP